MKTLYRNILCAALPLAMGAMATGCSDMDGDGIGDFTYEGSENPENVSFHNPVWEPSLDGGTMMRTSANFVAISPETQWAAGLDYCCPTLYSYDMMKWTFNQQNAFSYDTPNTKYDPEDPDSSPVNKGSLPDWLDGKIVSLSADFAKTITGANYWMFYADASGKTIGAASATVAQGPYADRGTVLKAEDLGTETIGNPFFIVATTQFYLAYTTDEGVFVQRMNVRRNQTPTKQGSAFKIAGPEFKDVCIGRVSSSNCYFYGTVENADGKTEIRYARAKAITGPYLNKAGDDIASGAEAELLVKPGVTHTNPAHPMRMLISEDDTHFLAYTASAVGNETMASGYTRRPAFLAPLAMDEEGWYTTVVAPETGWTSPRFK